MITSVKRRKTTTERGGRLLPQDSGSGDDADDDLTSDFSPSDADSTSSSRPLLTRLSQLAEERAMRRWGAITMEVYYPIQSSWPFFPASRFLLSAYSAIPQNYVHWTETPDSHLFGADLPGVRKDEIRVEVEDSKYMVIRTEWAEEGGGGDGEASERETRRGFMRKFRLPETTDIEGITAAYEDGVLTVTVPRSVSRRSLRLDLEEVADGRNSVARAA
ncbi:15.4 kDa class V heat shock protein [Canna indica]|uniref:15.4 kDa class V heat shock protein n=1 Tax=Canna indica TaxID=4628 RepID=A0AAQ3QP20_9LILI|nr:15.4 kDa class V heat shock protein [Canna indica]